MGFLDNKLLSITLGDLTYEYAKQGKTPNETVITVITGKDGRVFTLNKALVQSISKDLGNLIPDGFSISLENVTVVSQGTDMAFVGNFKTPLDLTKVPVVKDFIPAGRKLSILSTQLIHSPQQDGLSPADITTINELISNINKVLSSETSSTSSTSSNQLEPLPPTIKSGFDGSVILEIGPNKFVMMSDGSIHPYTSDQTAGFENSITPPKSTTAPKGVGPMTLQGIHFAYENNSFVFKISGSIALGPLSISFQNFTAASPFLPSDIHLDGLGIGMNQPPIFVEGGFTKVDKPENSNIVSEYNGKLTAGFNKISLMMQGSYASTNSYKSLYAFGVLGFPALGPPFLYLTDIAGGLGYNRELILPDPKSVQSYPFIQAIDNPDSLKTADNSIVPIKEDAYFGVAGIRAGSFKMVDSTLLLAFRMDREVEIDIVGYSDMKFPKPKDDVPSPEVLAELKIGYVARYLPDRGVLSVSGSFLPGSYIYNPYVHISGGFALLSIFKDQHGGQWDQARAGDFIFTIGGYAKNYSVQPYYPKVPRLQMSWAFSSNLYIKAQAYFAVTPNAMMAGGWLDANFQEGGDLSIRVHFTCGADFIIYWKPYYYSGDIYASLNVSAQINVDCWLFTIHAGVNFDIGANLTVWGPSFSGIAQIHVHVLVSFTVSVSFGNSNLIFYTLEAAEAAEGISWDEFSSSFLPDIDKILTGQITHGLIPAKSIIADNTDPTAVDYLVVNKKEVALSVKTAIPLHSVTGVPNLSISASEFGIKPMKVWTESITKSELQIDITKDGEPFNEDYFEFTLITENVPAALWQPEEDDSNHLIEGLATGFDIAVKKPDQPDDEYLVKGPIVDPIPGEKTTSNWGSTFTYSSNLGQP